MTALETMKSELLRIQAEQAECITEAGYVKSDCRYRYQGLTREAGHYKKAIDLWGKLFPGMEVLK